MFQPEMRKYYTIFNDKNRLFIGHGEILRQRAYHQNRRRVDFGVLQHGGRYSQGIKKTGIQNYSK